MTMKQVTPNRSFVPERSYKQTRTKIRCFKVLSYESDVDQTINISKSPIFTINMPTEESAIQLMKDLYYGEYTGG